MHSVGLVTVLRMAFLPSCDTGGNGAIFSECTDGDDRSRTLILAQWVSSRCHCGELNDGSPWQLFLWLGVQESDGTCFWMGQTCSLKSPIALPNTTCEDAGLHLCLLNVIGLHISWVLNVLQPQMLCLQDKITCVLHSLFLTLFAKYQNEFDTNCTVLHQWCFRWLLQALPPSTKLLPAWASSAVYGSHQAGLWYPPQLHRQDGLPSAMMARWATSANATLAVCCVREDLLNWLIHFHTVAESGGVLTDPGQNSHTMAVLGGVFFALDFPQIASTVVFTLDPPECHLWVTSSARSSPEWDSARQFIQTSLEVPKSKPTAIPGREGSA